MRLVIIPMVLIAIATVIYPFIVYYSIEHWGPANLAWCLLLLLLARVFVRQDFKQPEQYMQLAIVGSLCVLAAVFNSERLLRYYPVAMSVAFAFFFALSLRTEKPLIERFAAMSGRQFDQPQKDYMRSLTLAWAGLLMLNAIVASYTACCASLKIWTLYNGVIAYVIFGVFSIVELVYRHFYKLRIAREQS